ncbi:MAG: hypothetical protein AAF699_19105 [Pseudomonadota bacterium]
MYTCRKILTAPLAVLLGVLLSACEVPEGTLITECDDVGELHPICGLQSPEDIVVVPGDEFLLLSEMGGMEGGPGRIALFDIEDETWQTVFPLKAGNVATMPAGDPQCTDAPDVEFSPHGIHLVQLEDGRWRFLVVNHGGREAIELFDLTLPAEGSPELVWQGCVFPADNTFVNDVVGLSNGDIVYTRMYRPDDLASVWRGMLGYQTGDVWRWSSETGPRLLAGTEGSLTNGIQISADERYVFINQYVDQKVQKYNLEEEIEVASAAIANADNSAWGPSGELWVATHDMDVATFMACTEDRTVTCGMAFSIVALDPDTMEHRVIFSHQGPPMGAATVAVPLDDKVYLGSFLGDRLLVAPIVMFN